MVGMVQTICSLQRCCILSCTSTRQRIGLVFHKTSKEIKDGFQLSSMLFVECLAGSSWGTAGVGVPGPESGPGQVHTPSQ